MAEVRRPEKLQDLFGQDLTGWQISPVYFLELRHSLMAFFPLVDVDGEVVVVPEKEMLEMIQSCPYFPQRSAKVFDFLALWNPKEGFGFNTGVYKNPDAGPIKVHSREEIDKLCRLENGFSWKAG